MGVLVDVANLQFLDGLQIRDCQQHISQDGNRCWPKQKILPKSLWSKYTLKHLWDPRKLPILSKQNPLSK